MVRAVGLGLRGRSEGSELWDRSCEIRGEGLGLRDRGFRVRAVGSE